MGFSVSGSAAIIFVAAFIGFGMFYSATANSFERVNDAREDQRDRLLDQQNTDISLVSATWNESGNDNLVVTVDNTGSETLSVEATDLLVDNDYHTGYDTTVDTDSSTDIWASQERLEITVSSLSSQPDRVKVIAENGIAETMVVS
ncbi:flagellar protein F [Haloarcula japonica]|uniref:Archaeal flagellar protein F n=1 Tax=Haloarcula japonica (strain ATCC 49778 / DSM 6131 / JCM 7785 / NBRC 101032 / NCIMB 13157 / TR-1) TaxID=1227453 RepID=M0LQS4_HALJT|nr:flagellar protein F [Haloarcula japonica]EMA34400.1 archaeal flagellar protein F [Haloarcula japonica DSM 6131]